MTETELPAALRYALELTSPRPPTGATPPVQLERLPQLDRVVMLVGPGILAADAVEGLRAFAAAAHLGVANTWGAKGVFRWDSPHHLGTCGLQRDDFELLGLTDADLVITSGLDADESPADLLGGATCVDVAPEDLASFATRVPAARGPIVETELYRRIAAIAGPGYRDERVPRHPAAAVAALAAEHPGATVIAEPGLAGFWIGRVLPTEAPGSVVIPARGAPGVAGRLAEVAAKVRRAVVVVHTEPMPDVRAPVVVWDRDVDFSITQQLVAAAGPIRGLHAERLGRARFEADPTDPPPGD